MKCLWLDESLDLSINYHIVDDSGNTVNVVDGIPQQQYGDKYPIKPRLDREGHIFTTFQPQLIRRIIANRQSLLEKSNLALMPSWILDLRELINDTISLLDITLIQLYTKAQFDPEPGWIFEIEKLGQKNNRRLKDKLKWVRQISGKAFDIEDELKKLDELRKVRNHLNHFDPPTFAITLEEATDLINNVLYV